METGFWLVTTKNLNDKLWFKDIEDFKIGMNYVAVNQYVLNVGIVAFVLMSNHVHFVLECSFLKAKDFIHSFKKLYSQYYRKKYSIRRLLYGNEVSVQPVLLKDESFKWAVAYVQMNPVAANICLNPSGYPWGTGNVFFNSQISDGIQLGALSGRARIRLLRSKSQLPAEYQLDVSGFVKPSSYIKVKLVESVFRTPLSMDYYLKRSSKARRINEVLSFNDQLLSSAYKSLCVSLFKKNSVSELSDEDKSELLRQLRYRFSSDPNQLARVVSLPYETICRLLERI